MKGAASPTGTKNTVMGKYVLLFLCLHDGVDL